MICSYDPEGFFKLDLRSSKTVDGYFKPKKAVT